ncbi:MAG TPA: ATP-binding protein [Candidatus Hydrogenedentes bacterium]|nr:ATP-binding protein [Candidatus Hydrogenedentota bacterium]
MAAAKHLIALLKSHIAGDDDRFLSVAMQAAAHEARNGHEQVAQQLRALVDHARRGKRHDSQHLAPIDRGNGSLAALVSATFPETRLASMALADDLKRRLERVLAEQNQRHKLAERGLQPRRKLLFVGPPGSGKTMAAGAIAGGLGTPLFTVRFDALITRFMGETASRLRIIFDAISETRGVYFFDEFDAIGSRRADRNDVGEIRRVLNSLLQFLEADDSDSLIIAATNHVELLDPALFRRFDDVIQYELPNEDVALEIFQSRLAGLDFRGIDWPIAVELSGGLSQAEISRAADEAAKRVILSNRQNVTNEDLVIAIQERQLSGYRQG